MFLKRCFKVVLAPGKEKKTCLNNTKDFKVGVKCPPLFLSKYYTSSTNSRNFLRLYTFKENHYGIKVCRFFFST